MGGSSRSYVRRNGRALQTMNSCDSTSIVPPWRSRAIHWRMSSPRPMPCPGLEASKAGRVAPVLEEVVDDRAEALVGWSQGLSR